MALLLLSLLLAPLYLDLLARLAPTTPAAPVVQVPPPTTPKDPVAPTDPPPVQQPPPSIALGPTGSPVPPDPWPVPGSVPTVSAEDRAAYQQFQAEALRQLRSVLGPGAFPAVH